MPAAATVTSTYTCPLITPGIPPIPHTGGGIITKGAPNVLIGGLPAARVGDILTCTGPPPHPDTIAMGSATVFIGGMPAAFMTSLTSEGGEVLKGVPTVIIGQ